VSGRGLLGGSRPVPRTRTSAGGTTGRCAASLSNWSRISASGHPKKGLVAQVRRAGARSVRGWV